MQTKALVISILLPLLSTTAVVLTHFVIRSYEAKSDALTFILQVVPYCFLDTYEFPNDYHCPIHSFPFIYLVHRLTYMCGAYWYMSCEVLSKSAAIIAEDFQKVIFIIVSSSSQCFCHLLIKHLKGCCLSFQIFFKNFSNFSPCIVLSDD